MRKEDTFFKKMRRSFSKRLPGITLALYEDIDSTNNRAKEYALFSKARDDAFFIAKRQSEGRGRKGRSFLSNEGGLYLSYLCHPALLAEDSVRLTAFAAVCLCETIEELTALTPSIKWVNDVLSNGKKLAGILTEGAFSADGEKFDYAVVGIGVNLAASNFPPELADIAADIETLDGKRPDIFKFASRLAEKLTAFEKRDFSEYMDEYRKRSLALGRCVNIISAEGNYPADVLSIDDNGALWVKDSTGQEKRLVSGEISIKL